MLARDYYFVLDVPPISSPERIRQAYRTLSKKYHPDLNPNDKLNAEVRMKELVEAYSHLIDPDKRKLYDKLPLFQVRRFRRPERTTRTAPTSEPQKPPGMLQRLLGFFRR